MNTPNPGGQSPAYFAIGAPLFRQFAAATRGRLPLRDVSHLLAQDRQLSSAHRSQLDTLTEHLAAAPLSAAMGKVPRVFPSTTADWVRLAESHDRLADTLDVLAQDGERERMGRSELRLAMAWPMAVSLVLFAMLSVVVTFVVPAFSEIYVHMGVALPALSLKVFSLVQTTVGYWWLWLPLLVLLAVCLAKRALPVVVLQGLDGMKHRIGFVHRLSVARFMARLVGLLQASGTDATLQRAALAHLSATTATPALAALGTRLYAAVQAGTPLSTALEMESQLPQRAALYVRLGEKMQNLTAPLAQLSQEVDTEHRLAIARFERGIILTVYLVLGLVVGVFVAATYLPIFNLGQMT